MTSFVSHASIDSADAYALSEFWKQVLGYVDVEDARDQEVQRLLGVGAVLVADLREDDRTGWAVLADPEGNEFCILRSAQERASTEA